MRRNRDPIVRPQRFQVNENYRVRLTVQRTPNCTPASFEAELLDLSTGGAKLSLAEPIRFQEAINLKLDSEELNLHLSASATVAWVRAAKDGRWTLGCAFDPLLPYNTLEQMFSHGLLERRRSRRESVRGQAMATWEPNITPTPVGLLDLSDGGFSVLSPIEATNGSRLCLSYETQDGERRQVPACIRWQLQVEGGFVIGATFLDYQSYLEVKSNFATCEQDAWRHDAAPRFGALSFWSLAGLILIVCVLLWRQSLV